MSKVSVCEIQVCYDCLAIHANGELGDDSIPDCEPWGLMPDDDVSMGSVSGCDCKNDYQDDCECDYTDFSWSPCDACGSSLGGYRHTFTVWGDESCS